MTLRPTARFVADYHVLPKQFRRRVDKALGLLLENPRHPSLQVKKMQGYDNRWEGRITLQFRFTFSIDGDAYVLLRVGTHDLLK